RFYITPYIIMAESKKEVSLLSLASSGFEKIKNLSDSQLISDKLLALNMLLYVIVLSLIITNSLLPNTLSDTFSFLVYLAVSAIFALISNLLYGPLLETISKFSSNRIQSIRVSIVFLFIAITLVVGGIVFNNKLLVNLSGGLVGLQVLLIPFLSFFFKNSKIQDVEIDPSQIWTAIGRLASVVSIVSFILDLILIIMKVSLI
ncbi:MAG: hypothetical protein NTW30_04095, partial [Candidatus Aenigmarchaeota archaeon]|nr:hypothetical protein [Candidatus Aenigmarchaeota archaeon]